MARAGGGAAHGAAAHVLSGGPHDSHGAGRRCPEPLRSARARGNSPSRRPSRTAGRSRWRPRLTLNVERSVRIGPTSAFANASADRRSLGGGWSVEPPSGHTEVRPYCSARLPHRTRPFLNGHESIGFDVGDPILRAARPVDLNRLGGGVLSETKRQGQITLRTVARSTVHGLDADAVRSLDADARRRCRPGWPSCPASGSPASDSCCRHRCAAAAPAHRCS